ncbi:PAX-interacting protein 1, partial [Coelomomyces lativittatus]
IDDPIEFCELCATIEAFGGQWRNGGDLENPDPLTTHVVGKKNHISERTAQLLQTRFSHLPHVDVAWLVDSSIRQTRFSFHSYPLFPQVRAIEELHRPPFYFHLDAFNTFHTCLKHKRIYFHSDVPSHLLEPFKKIISLSEGKVLDSSVEAETVLRLADVLIFKHAHSSLFISAVQQKKWVATPYWFLDVLYYGQWISPWSLLLYFPFPFKKRSLQDACVGLTQFRGRHRQIVKELCTLLGFTCTSVLSTKTQFLIVGKAEGPKYLTAQQHGLPIVTLDWLEQSLAQGHRPPLTTLPPLWRPTLHVCQPVLEITVAWVLKEVLHQVHQHHQRTQKLLSQLGSQKSSLSPIKKQRVAKELASTKWNLQYASLATMDSKEREWVLKTWEDENDVDETVDVMDVQDPDDQETLISSSDVPIQPSTQSTVVILCYAKHKPSARDLKAFQSLGIQVAKLNEPFTHYVISHLELDACFLYAMYSAKYMVTPKWVDACIRERKLLDPYPYRLRDPVLENKYNFVLTTALEKAKFCQLLTGWTITSATLSDEVFPAYLARVVWKAGGKIIPLSKIDSKFPPPLLLFLHFSSPKPENISMLSSTFPDLYQCDLETFKRVLLCQSLQPLFETVN